MTLASIIEALLDLIELPARFALACFMRSLPRLNSQSRRSWLKSLCLIMIGLKQTGVAMGFF